MAAEVQIGGTDDSRIFIGQDSTIPVHVKDFDPPSGNTDGTVAKEITGWALTFDVRKLDKSGTVILSKTVGAGITIAGVFNATASSNLQRATVALDADLDLTVAKFSIDGGTFRYSLKRTDDGSETVLAYGDFVVDRATQT